MRRAGHGGSSPDRFGLAVTWLRFPRRRSAALVALVLVLAAARPALAYLKFAVRLGGDREVTLQWTGASVRYFITDLGVPAVGPSQLAGALARAFSTWQDVPTASLTYTFGGFTDALPGESDGRSTLGFVAVPELERVLASTSFLIDEVTGELLEADIFFNAAFPWSVSSEGEPGRFDLETIAVHEIGHLSGLGHSAIGETEVSGNGRRVIAAESVMFPIAFGAGNIASRQLRADDVAGISDVYPDGDFERRTGVLSERITKNGLGLFGAHVVAFNPATRALVGGFSANAQGEFSIAGLSPGPHVLRIEPLDDADVESFFESDPELPADLDFQAMFFDRLVVVPRGGGSRPVEIAVRAK